MIGQNILVRMILLIAVGLLAGCTTAPPPTASEITAQPSKIIEVGKTASLDITAEGTELQFEWTVERGKLSNSSQAAVIYTAPDTPGLDVVTVKVKTKSGEIVRDISFEVVEPTPEPTATLPPTATPPPIACNYPLLTNDVFPQLANEEGQFPIYGPAEGAGSEDILCEAVTDPLHEGPLSVHFRYTKVDKNVGWFGIATPNGYDASQHEQLCFWAYATQPRQTFRFKMRDTSGKDTGVVTTISTVNDWEEICMDISEFADLGINVQQMDNVNLGFEDPLGSAEIWVADFEFR